MLKVYDECSDNFVMIENAAFNKEGEQQQ